MALLEEGLLLGHTESVCPVCLKRLPADIIRKGGRRGEGVFLRRVCPEHGEAQGLIWRGAPDFEQWRRPKKRAVMQHAHTAIDLGCPHDCGLCPEHGQHSCTVVLEITGRCNLRCPVCFADAGDGADVPLGELKRRVSWIHSQAADVVLQISGGEPTLHPDLAELIAFSAPLFPAVQCNTNGLALAADPSYAKALAGAGLSWVFLQFDGTTDDVYRQLRGRPLLEQKLRAVEHCRGAGLSVVFVPTVAKGVNDDNLGELVRLAASLSPTVRGVHLQPMGRMGRNAFDENSVLTMPEVIQSLSAQTGGLIRPGQASPPGCEHERCSFHMRFRLDAEGGLVPLRGQAACCTSSVLGGENGAPGGAGSAAKGATGSALGASCCAPADSAAGCCSPSDNTEGNAAKLKELTPLQAPSCCGAPESLPSPVEAAATAMGNVTLHWGGDSLYSLKQSRQAEPPVEPDGFDRFLAQMRQRSFSITCMAFQDAWSLDLERLRGCCVHVYAQKDGEDRFVPFCAYNLTDTQGRPLYR